MTDRIRGQLIGLVVLGAIALGAWWLGTDSDSGTPVETNGSVEETVDVDVEPALSEVETVPEESAQSEQVAQPTSGLAPISLAELPDEALEILSLIDSDGPFKYDKDGSTFQNREAILPDEASGYYREYTVDTPGAYDRGARRIVGGVGGERYYTDDHYGSFSEIVDG